jgi:hypothetical protein
MPPQPLDAIPLWGILVAVTAMLAAGFEGGFRFGRWRRAHVPEEREQVAGAMVASILGLVALVLGFTFSLAAARYDARRLGVLEEANAIGTTWLRTRFLPKPQGDESARLLREYVDVRLQGIREGQTAKAIARSNELHFLLWEQAVASREAADTVSTGLYIQSLNQVIDLHATRLLDARSRIPPVLWAALYFLATLGTASVGYTAGLIGQHRSPVAIALILSFACVLYLIADLDRSQEGLIRVSQKPMQELQESIKEVQP